MRQNILIIALALISTLWIVSSCGKDKDNGFSDIELPASLQEEDADLIIEGMIDPETVYLDLETITSFPKTSFTSYDPWDKKEYTYTGVSIIEMLEYLNVSPSAVKIEVQAENDYMAPIGVEDLKRYEYILAYELDGALLGTEESLTKKGKLMVAINFEKHHDIDVEVYKNQLVWQVNHIFVE